MDKLTLTSEEQDLIESLRNYKKLHPENRQNQEFYILDLVYSLMGD